MKTYIVNLERSTDRRKYMEQLLSNCQKLDIEFIPAVDGRIMSDAEKEQQFNSQKFAETYLKKVRPGEIGCTLSHQKCYKQLLKSRLKSVLILEDDIIPNEPIDNIIPTIERCLDTDVPTLILLSGWYWFTSKREFDGSHKLAKVCDGYLTHAYALNKAAAEMMVDERPWYVADAWDMFRKRGVKMYGILPHPIDQDWSGAFKTYVSDDNIIHTQTNIPVLLGIKFRGACQHALKLIGKFEPAIHGEK